MASSVITNPTGEDTDPQTTLGSIHLYNGKLYRYIKLVDAIDAVAGSVVFAANAAYTQGTCDYTGGATGPITGVPCIGIAAGTITAGKYAFVQVSGVATVNTDGDDDIAAGDIVITGAADGVCESVASASSALNIDVYVKIIGTATAADDNTANTVTVKLKGLI